MTQARGVSVVLHRVDGSDIAISSDQLAAIAPTLRWLSAPLATNGSMTRI